MEVPPRQPYAGDLAFTAFSGSHQDAIRKGFQFMKDSGTEYWEVPYLPINPADLNRDYEPVIRINSQSGKGGAAFVLEQTMGYKLPKEMHPEFGNIVKAAADDFGDELTSLQIVDLFRKNYLNLEGKYKLVSHNFSEVRKADGIIDSCFEGVISVDGVEKNVVGYGNGPINSFCKALNSVGLADLDFVNYHEHAVGNGSTAKAICYIEVERKDGKHFFGAAMHPNVNIAAMLGIICASNRAIMEE